MNLYQIESTSARSATCSFCPHPSMERAKAKSMATFRLLIDAMSNSYVALHHFGEPLLNPNLPDMIRYANSKGKRD